MSCHAEMFDDLTQSHSDPVISGISQCISWCLEWWSDLVNLSPFSSSAAFPARRLSSWCVSSKILVPSTQHESCSHPNLYFQYSSSSDLLWSPNYFLESNWCTFAQASVSYSNPLQTIYRKSNTWPWYEAMSTWPLVCKSLHRSRTFLGIRRARDDRNELLLLSELQYTTRLAMKSSAQPVWTALASTRKSSTSQRFPPRAWLNLHICGALWEYLPQAD